MKNVRFFLLAFIGLISLAGCNSSDENEDENQSTTNTIQTLAIYQGDELLSESSTLHVDNTIQLNAIATFVDGTKEDITEEVVWSSSDTSISVNNQGFATANASGHANVSAMTVADISVKSIVAFTVPNSTLSAIKLETQSQSYSLPLGNSESLKAIGYYSDGSLGDVTLAVDFNVADPTVLTVDTSGVVTTLTVGETDITASSKVDSSTTSNNITLEVVSSNLTGIVVTSAESTIIAGGSTTLTATGKYADGIDRDISSTVNWSSSSKDVGINSYATTITAQGYNPVASALISANYAGVESNDIALEVKTAEVTSIDIYSEVTSVPVGFSANFKAVGHYSDNTTVDITDEVTFASSAPTVAVIGSVSDSQLTVTASAVGTSSISASMVTPSNNTITSTAIPITVTAEELTSIAITSSATSAIAGTDITMTATGTFSGGTTSDITASVLWISSDITVATIDSSGVITTLMAGTTNITATKVDTTSGQSSSALSITVSEAELVSIDLPTSIVLPVTIEQQVTAVGRYSNGLIQNITTTSTWSSDNTAVASVVATTGVVTALKAGTAEITVSHATSTTNPTPVTKTTSIEVTAASLDTIEITPAAISLPLGGRQQMTAVGTYLDGSTSDLTNSVTWSVGSSTFASIDNEGLLLAIASGNTAVNAVFQSIAATPATLTVIASGTTDLRVCDPASATLATDLCLQTFETTTSGVFITSTPSLVVTRYLGYDEMAGNIQATKTYAYTYNEDGINYALFDQLGGDIAGIGGQLQNWCTELTTIGFNGKTWNVPTVAELQDVATADIVTHQPQFPMDYPYWTNVAPYFSLMNIVDLKTGQLRSNSLDSVYYGACISQ